MRLPESKGSMLVLVAAVILGCGPVHSAERRLRSAAEHTGTLLANSAPIERQVDAIVHRQTCRILGAGSSESLSDHDLYPMDLRDAWGTADLHVEGQPLASVEINAPKGVKESTAVPEDVPPGLSGLLWAAQRPGDAWRLFTPISR